jgi:hypothetical protein
MDSDMVARGRIEANRPGFPGHRGSRTVVEQRVRVVCTTSLYYIVPQTLGNAVVGDPYLGDDVASAQRVAVIPAAAIS